MTLFVGLLFSEGTHLEAAVVLGKHLSLFCEDFAFAHIALNIGAAVPLAQLVGKFTTNFVFAL